ncbi:hypothetical protein D3C71_1139630 [compost metagenome]
MRALALMPTECFHALLAGNALAFIAEDHRVTIEGDTQLRGGATGNGGGSRRSAYVRCAVRQDRRGGDAVHQRTSHRFRVGGEEQIGTERFHIRPGRLTGGERRADDAQAVMLDGVEDAQAGIGRIARQQDHLHTRRFVRCALVEGQQLAHHRKRDAGLEHIVLVFALIRGVGFQAIAFEEGVPFFQVEQSARGHRDGEKPGSVVTHE